MPVPGGGLDKPTDRNQWSWVFLKDLKKTLLLTENPQKILSEKQNPKKYPQKHCSFRETQALCDNNGTHDY